jgi:hypothetical protein
MLLAAPACLAAAPAGAAADPSARAALFDEDPGTDCAEDELAIEEEDGTVTCSGDALSDDGFGDEWAGDDSGTCDDWAGLDDSEEEGDDAEVASIATADDDEEYYDDACADDDTAAAPQLSALTAKVAGQGRRARVTVSWVLDAPGKVALKLERTEPGVSSGTRCVGAAKQAGKRSGKQSAAGKHARRGGKSCTRAIALRGAVVIDGKEGANSLELRRWKGRRIAPGSYRLAAAPTAAGGARVTTTFKLAPAAR